MFHHPWRLYVLHNWSVNVTWQLTIACQCEIYCASHLKCIAMTFMVIYLYKITKNHTAIKKMNGGVARHKRLSYSWICRHRNEKPIQTLYHMCHTFFYWTSLKWAICARPHEVEYQCLCTVCFFKKHHFRHDCKIVVIDIFTSIWHNEIIYIYIWKIGEG